MPEPLLSPEEREVMRRYFLAARSWDKHRRDMIRREPNDPVQNRIAYNHLMEMVHNVHPGLLVDDKKEDEAESRLARALCRR
ncbi:MAG: hypothetical protein IT445_18690 [Phycisphaeraceae bacterium]|nr:hypothetical protein [Phycisphaeraceae bacterium]